MTTDAPELPAHLVTFGGQMECVCEELGSIADALTILALQVAQVPEAEAGALTRLRLRAWGRLRDRASHRAQGGER